MSKREAWKEWLILTELLVSMGNVSCQVLKDEHICYVRRKAREFWTAVMGCTEIWSHARAWQVQEQGRHARKKYTEWKSRLKSSLGSVYKGTCMASLCVQILFFSQQRISRFFFQGERDTRLDYLKNFTVKTNTNEQYKITIPISTTQQLSRFYHFSSFYLNEGF